MKAGLLLVAWFTLLAVLISICWVPHIGGTFAAKKKKRGFRHKLPVSWCDHLPNVIYQACFLFIDRRKRPCIVVIRELFFIFKNALVYVVSEPVDVKLRPIWGGPFLSVSRCRKASAHKRRKIEIGVLKSKRRTEKYKTQRRKQVFIEIHSIASNPSQSRLIIADPRAGSVT